MRSLATIRTLDSISPIEGADKIELAHIGGWQCVVEKGKFNPGDQGVFFEIDSALPYEDERYAFLRERCGKRWINAQGEVICQVIRIKTAKFKGQISQGLFLPVREFPEIAQQNGQYDVTSVLKIQHYDELKEKMDLVTGKARISGEQKGNFPSFIPKTDEERLQNLTDYFEKMKNVEFECTEKFDGSSMTVFYAPTYRENCPFLVGPGLNANRDQYTAPEFRVFRIFNIEEQKWLFPEERYSVCEQLGLFHVKVIRKCWKVFDELLSMGDFLQFVKGKTDRGHEREGMVWKSMDGVISFKVINNEYLLKQKD